MQNIFPKSELVSIPTKFSSKSPTNGNSRITSDNQPGPPDLDCDTETRPDNVDDRISDGNHQVRIFLPSSWAKMDYQLLSLFRLYTHLLKAKNSHQPPSTTPRLCRNESFSQDLAITSTSNIRTISYALNPETKLSSQL